jgi:hypothetical protein
MMASALEELIVGFPHSGLQKITYEPTLKDLKIFRCLLNTNDRSVSSYEGGGLHGHLGIIMMHDEYFAAVTDVFPNPVNPGAHLRLQRG